MQLHVGTDLKPVYLLFARIQRNYPQHLSATLKLKKTVDSHIDRYKDCLIHYAKTNKVKYRDLAQRELDSIAALLTIVEKQELMAILSNESVR